MTLTFCWDLTSADWIVHSDLPWQQLVGFGPAGFDAYARLRFLPDPARPGQSETGVDPQWRTGQVPTLLEVLATHTTTPDSCYFCVWDGFGSSGSATGDDAVYLDDGCGGVQRGDAEPGFAPLPVVSPTTSQVPKVMVPNRSYWLFRGPLTDAGTWDAAHGLPAQLRLDAAEPAFIWPADQAWCVAQDVDPHWAGIGGSTLLLNQLIADRRLDVVPANPTEEQPSYQ